MALKNIFNSTYAIVENTNYNGPRKALSFDLVLYRDSNKLQETGRMQYQVHGNLKTKVIDSVITSIPAGLEMEAYPEDFDFDALDDFKPYLIGNNPTESSWTVAGGGELRTGFHYCCETGPEKINDPENEGGPLVWPKRAIEGEYEEVDNPAYDASIPKTLRNDDDTEDIPNPEYEPEKIQGAQKYEAQKIKYDWGPKHEDLSVLFVDKDGKYWEVIGDTGSQTVNEVTGPFLESDWNTWFSSTAMDAKDKNLQSQIYTWLKAKPEYKDAVDI